MGDGRAARTLAPLLRQAGHELLWQWSRRTSQPVVSLAPVDAVLIAVSDHAIAEISRRLAQRTSAADEVWLHLSGALPSQTARWDDRRPRAVGTLHPMVALPGATASPDHLRGATCGIAGDGPAVKVARALGESLQMTVVQIGDDDRALYHAAAVTVAGHATALLSQATDMLRRVGFEEEQARGALAALMHTALDNLSDGTPADQITGPVARGDARTVGLHLEALQRELPEALPSYVSLARASLSLSRAALTPQVAQAIELELKRFTP
jgi:predicted short-subunit dehydrogenase-like oxidoreductase (DUF2520 family)